MAKETWRLIESGFCDGYFNMAVDEVLMGQKEKGEIPSTLRFYAWRPPAISIGYTQKIGEEIDLRALGNSGISCVSRVTGGGIIFHNQELTYSLAIGPDSYLFSNFVGESFRRICAGIIRAMEFLGLRADFARDCQGMAISNSDVFCFAAHSSYDIIIGNKKLGGNAQRRKKKVILQHGSIPLKLDYEPVLPLLKNFSGEEMKGTSLEEQLKSPLSFDRALEVLKRGFREGLNIELEPGGLTQEEIKMAEGICQDKREQFSGLKRGENA